MCDPHALGVYPTEVATLGPVSKMGSGKERGRGRSKSDWAFVKAKKHTYVPFWVSDVLPGNHVLT